MDEKRKKEILEFLSTPLFKPIDVDEKSLPIFDQALTHSSYAKELKDRKLKCDDYERLEFLGNFVLNFVVSEYIFKKYIHDSEGLMSKRMGIVSNEILSHIIMEKNIGIEKHIKFGKGVNKKDLEDSIIAGAFEALIGAVYCDKRMKKAKKLILDLLSDEIEGFDIERNYIGKLQEVVQIKKHLPSYDVDEIAEPSHTFRAVVKISGKMCGEGTGNSKRAAKMAAARAALNKMEKAEKGLC